MVPGQGFIVVGNKTQKIQFVYLSKNKMSDTRGKTIRHNVQKSA
jgi:hypothetical protein